MSIASVSDVYDIPVIDEHGPFPRHPDASNMVYDWGKFRSAMKSGHDFVRDYLKEMSSRESVADFNERKCISYCPAHAKSALTEIKNAIYQRMIDITRTGGSETYQRAILGIESSVDRRGNSMNSFIGNKVLFEMLGMGKVGVYVDRPIIPEKASYKDSKDKHPYLYLYHAEDIWNWRYDENDELITVLLKDTTLEYDDNGLASKSVIVWRLLNIVEGGVEIKFFNASKKETKPPVVLPLDMIPFVIFEINASLLTDIVDYQIAHTNLASADLNYIRKANFPFLVEMADPQNVFATVKKNPSTAGDAGTASEAKVADADAVRIGISQGRRYSKGLDAPQFIHPSSEPLLASMKKQEEMKREIRELANLALSNIEPRRASAESKKEERVGKEEGLSYIGLELEHNERQIAKIWDSYEQTKTVATIKYPMNYSLRTEEDRRAEAKELKELIPTIPSLTYQKEIAKRIADVTVSHHTSAEVLTKIFSEIEDSEVIVIDPEVINIDHEAGLVGDKLASKLRGYPEGEAEIAAKDHADRAARIALAQSEATGQARGVKDLGNNPKAGNQEKKQSNG